GRLNPQCASRLGQQPEPRRAGRIQVLRPARQLPAVKSVFHLMVRSLRFGDSGHWITNYRDLSPVVSSPSSVIPAGRPSLGRPVSFWLPLGVYPDATLVGLG